MSMWDEIFALENKNAIPMTNRSMLTLRDTIASLDRLLNSPSFSESQKAQAKKLKDQLSNELKRWENQESPSASI